MHFTPSETRERHAFVEQTLATAAETYAAAEVSARLGNIAGGLIKMLPNLTIPNIRHGEIKIPADQPDITGLIPVVALKEGDRVYIGNQFGVQTKRQRINTLKVFESWDPIETSAGDLLDAIVYVEEGPEKLIPLELEESVQAQTLSIIQHFNALVCREYFHSVKPGRVGSIAMRPLLLLGMDDDSKSMTPDLFAHELVHIGQRIEDPVDVFDSQEDVNTSNLRLELEAYNVGTYVCLGMGDGGDVMEREDPEDPRFVQLAVESTRWFINQNNTDPYEPTPELVKMLADDGMGHIAHHVIDFEAIAEEYSRQ